MYREIIDTLIKAIASRYDHIDFTPPQGVREAARRGLELRREHGRGGLSTKQASGAGVGSGVQRASDLMNGERLSPGTIKRMRSFFARHSAYKEHHEDRTSAAYISWLLWGGDAGERWANKVYAQMERADAQMKKARGERADTPAEPHERVTGSEKNPKGSARSRTSGAKIEITKQIESALRDKVKEHNESAEHEWQKVTLGTLKSVFRRGAGAFSVSHRPSQNRQSWAYARVNAFLEIANGGGNPKFVQDNDLLDDEHPRNKAKKAHSWECCGDPLHKARGARGGEIDLVMDLASQMRGAYEQRLTALQRDLDALADNVKD